MLETSARLLRLLSLLQMHRDWSGSDLAERLGDDASCLLHVGADSPWALSWMITSIDTDFTVTGPPELVEQIELLALRCAAAVRA